MQSQGKWLFSCLESVLLRYLVPFMCRLNLLSGKARIKVYSRPGVVNVHNADMAMYRLSYYKVIAAD
jgi:hypothetical protein